MICFRDKTFCLAKSCKKFNNCDRALTEKVMEDAEEWWGRNDKEPPISITLKMDCYEPGEIDV